jgi:hypothetical protein
MDLDRTFYLINYENRPVQVPEEYVEEALVEFHSQTGSDASLSKGDLEAVFCSDGLLLVLPLNGDPEYPCLFIWLEKDEDGPYFEIAMDYAESYPERPLLSHDQEIKKRTAPTMSKGSTAMN